MSQLQSEDSTGVELNAGSNRPANKRIILNIQEQNEPDMKYK